MRSMSKRRFGKWSLAVIAAAGMALPAAAQESRGSFTIAKEVHWSMVTLPPGQYVYSLERRSPGVLLCVRPKSGGTGYFLMANSVSTLANGGEGELTIERRGDGWYVTSMTVHDTGEKLLFAAPRIETASTEAKLATIASR